jgi:hypothetical protein
LLENSAQEPQTLAQTFYHNSSGDIYDQALEQINQLALNRLGLGHLEVNQYLPEKNCQPQPAANPRPAASVANRQHPDTTTVSSATKD